MVVAGPYSGGQSHQRQPLLSTCTMPLITRRSSTRSTPRTSVGRWGLIRDHCSSLSQNKFLRTIPVPLPNSNQDRIVSAKELMSSDLRSFGCLALSRRSAGSFPQFTQIFLHKNLADFVTPTTAERLHHAPRPSFHMRIQ